MDGFTIKPRDSASRPAAVTRTSPVRTELAPAQSVMASAASATSHSMDDPGDSGPHEYQLESQSQKVVDRERDISRRRPRRSSDEALLRMRAYGRTLVTDEDEEQPENLADFKA